MPSLEDLAAVIYLVFCDCGFFGMRDECAYGICPWCGGRVRAEKKEEA